MCCYKYAFYVVQCVGRLIKGSRPYTPNLGIIILNYTSEVTSVFVYVYSLNKINAGCQRQIPVDKIRQKATDRLNNKRFCFLMGLLYDYKTMSTITEI